jgi:hypothetical protein
LVALDQNIDNRDCALESGVPRCSTQQGGAAAPERYATPSSSSDHRRAPVWAAAAAAVRLHATISAGSSSEAIRRNNASESSCEPPRGGNVCDRFKQATVIEPVDPPQRCELHRLQAAPRAGPADQLGLVQPDDRFGQRVVVGIADTAHRGLESRLLEPLGVSNRKVLGEFN